LLHLVRHGATEANSARPPRLQGRYSDLPLASLGILQAEAARGRLAGIPVYRCWCSPLRRAFETAAIVANPKGLTPHPLEALTACDLGCREGLTWDEVRQTAAAAYAAFLADLLGLGVGRARELILPNGAFAVVARDGGTTRVLTPADDAHLHHLPSA
jgi:broad specificity phosphatase PhoE